MSEVIDYRAVITPDGSVRVTSQGGKSVHTLSADQIRVLWLTFVEGGLRSRLSDKTPDRNRRLWRAVTQLRKADLLYGDRSYADLNFSVPGLEVAEFLFEKWAAWDLYSRKFKIT